MAFDACMMRAVLSEYNRDFAGARIEKVVMPQNDEVDLVLHAGQRSMRLVFNVGPNAPRLQLSRITKENPKVPPMFCMFLRKRLGGARILRARQLGFDRIACFDIAASDDMGFPVELSLICEIMGKYANLILTDKEGKILSALKMIDFSASTVRQILPGLMYEAPSDGGKRVPLVIDRDAFFAQLDAFPKERTVEKFITGTYGGIATQIAHELCYRATGAIDVPLLHVDTEQLYRVFFAWQTLLSEQSYRPTLVYDETGKPKDYSYMPITYLGDGLVREEHADFAALLDRYFEEKDRLERLRQRAHDLISLISHAKARTEKKLILQREALRDSERAEEYRRAGELITANLYQLKKGMRECTVIDYYDPACPERTLPLDERLTPAQNAQKMYKLYAKCKTAKTVLTACIEEWERELVYLESVGDFLHRAQTEADLLDLRDELYRAGYASRMKGYRPGKESKQRPYETTTSGGYTVLIGRNNLQNDQLTFKVADKGDLWFHVKDQPGSHVILRCHGEEPSEVDYTEAAALAAGYSRATGDAVAVDYTRVKQVKKPPGAKPGYVIYHTNYTAYVKPMKIGENVTKSK